MKGKISITQTYVAGGTSLYVDTPDVNLGTLKFGSEKKVNYLVNFDANGGTNVPNAGYKRIYVAYALPTEAPTRTGYTLKGWNTAANGTGINYDFTYSANAVTTLYAQWSQNQYLTYNANGHGTAPNTVTMTYNTATNAADAISATGYTFNGWNTKADGTGTKYAAGAQVKAANVNPAATTLYAQWTENTATLTYNNGGHGTAPEAVTMKYSEAVNAASAITAEGYTFTGWKGSDGKDYAANAEVKAANVNPVATTLYAQWKANTYPVTLNNGEGSGDTSVTATYNTLMPNVTVPTWEKHVFKGYYSGENGEGEKYIDETGKGVKSLMQADDNLVLYAHWVEAAKVESMDLTLGGDIEMRYHVAVNDPELKESGTMTVSIGSKKPSSEKISASKANTDSNGFVLFPFNVSSIQMAEPVKVEFKDKDGKVMANDAKSVEDYYNLVKDSATASDDQKEMVRTLVDYGYYAQQALSKTRGWTIGSDYKASTLHGSLSSTANDLKAYKPVISGADTNVKDIQLSLLLDNKTTLCIYVQTKNKTAPTVSVDGESVTPEDNGNGWWLVKIPNIDALNLSTMHTVEVNGYTVYLSALSYASVASDNETINAMCALLDYYHATLKANNKTALTSATVAQSEYEYTGEVISPNVTVYAGSTQVTDCKVTWNGNLTDAGTYTGLVTKDGYVGGVTVKVTITPKKVEVPKANANLTYNGSEQTGVTAEENAAYTLTGNTATEASSYTAKATLNDTKNTCWTDGTTDGKTIEWSIAKADPTVIDTVKVTYHPNGGSAEFIGSMSVGGAFSYDPSSGTTTFTPGDTTNYNTVSVEADVTEDQTATTVAVSLS